MKTLGMTDDDMFWITTLYWEEQSMNGYKVSVSVNPLSIMKSVKENLFISFLKMLILA